MTVMTTTALKAAPASETGPRVIASGFTALDVVLGPENRVAAGGTAANVAAALASMAWDASLATTVGDDLAGQFIREDLEQAGLDLTHLILDASWTTPIVLQERKLDDDHVWRFFCPLCGVRFARHRPAGPKTAAALLDNTAAPDVFFFDRPSLFTLTLAEEWRAVGALVVFEPSGLGRPHLFDRAVNASHLVKYSAQRARSFDYRLFDFDGALVRTAGADGASFRPAGGRAWYRQGPRRSTAVVDTAGAGDWTTAGMLATMLDKTKTGTGAAEDLASSTVLGEALMVGQEWGAKACTWAGARPKLNVTGARNNSEPPLPRVYCPAAQVP
jgi:fructokinase